MCGIAGVLGGGSEAEAQAAAMIEAIKHRGPNGVRIERVGDAVLAHARLSIIDLEGGWQPLHAAGSTVIGNGEIYNYLELIEEHGLECATGSDFEPLLHLYAREGERAFARLRGMYAFCLIGGDGRTWLVRDPFGIKPLYILEDFGDGPAAMFASEWRATIGFGGVKPALSKDNASELLSLAYTLGMRGKDDDLYRQGPGVATTADLGPRDQQMFEVHNLPGPRSDRTQPSPMRDAFNDPLHQEIDRRTTPASSDEQVLLQLDAVLEDSVRVHQRSDVPYGLFLSGGIDSAAIATLMARLNERPVTACTCGFEAPGARDERAQAERVARALNLDWRETSFGEADFWRILPQVAWALDDPTTDYATLPTYKLAEAAKDTLTVVLTGEGGDELFGGYGRYRRALRPRLFGGRPAEPQVDAPFLKDGGEGALERWRQAAKAPPGLTRLQEAQWADIATWLPNDLLLKLDRCLMAHGLEGRTPFLDREVAAFAFNLPDRLKVRGRYGKWILRKWLERCCPAAEPWAKKQGFTVPVAAWIAPRAADLAPAMARHEGLAQVCDMDAVQAIFAREGGEKHLWPLLFYAVWWNIHVGGMEPDEALAHLLPSP